MTTRKLEFSLRLRHDADGLAIASGQFGIVAHAGWDKGEQNRTLQGSPRAGTREFSYRSFSLEIPESTDLEIGLSESLKRLLPYASILNSLTTSGGMASLAVAWYCDSAVGGDRIPAKIVAEIAQLGLTLDFYLYLSPTPLSDVPQEDINASEARK